MQYENTIMIPKRKNLRYFICSTRGMRWSRLFCVTLTLDSLAKSYASLFSCIGFLHPVDRLDFSMVAVPLLNKKATWETWCKQGEG